MTSVFAAARLPVCSTDGALSGFHPVEMAALVLGQLLDRASLDAEQIQEVWVGCAEPVGAQGADMARAAVLTAGWPIGVAGVVVDAAEFSGTAALHAAVAAVEAGQVGFAAVVGVSNSSLVPPGAAALGRTYGRPWSDGPAARFESLGGLPAPHHGADRAAVEAGFGRSDQDLVLRRSLERRASRPPPPAVFEVAARFPAGSGAPRHSTVTTDVLRHLPDGLTRLAPAFNASGTVTAATFAPPADGCSGLLIGPTHDRGQARILATGRSGGDPRSPRGGAAAALAIALNRAGLNLSDVVRWEILEPSAAALLCICEAIGLDPALVNPYGGALATGDCAAAEEIRMVVDSIETPRVEGPIVAMVSGPTGAAVTVLESI